jgi:nucleotide-binding universal stress UspA family protein
MSHPHPSFTGMLLALTVLGAISGTLYWMLHPPKTKADRVASKTERDVEHLIGSVVVVFAKDIHSEHMLALAVRLARREKAELRALYVVEVPHTLPLDAEMPAESRAALDVLATAEALGRNNNVEIATEIVMARQVSQGVLDVAKRREAHMIVMGAYREGKYSGAPLAKAIEVIAGKAKCDVLIGVQGEHGNILTPPAELVNAGKNPPKPPPPPPAPKRTEPTG